jgi:hypothetical protein
VILVDVNQRNMVDDRRVRDSKSRIVRFSII